MPQSNSVSSVQLTNITSNPNALKNGSNVFVRVLAKGQGGEYLVSFAGNKFNVYSQKELQTGNAFRALVTIKDGKVFLSPQSQGNQSVQKFSATNSESISNLTGLLQDLGLKSDGISLRLVQYFHSSGLSFNMKLANKARAIGLHFPGKEADAAEIALFLEHRGISADVDSVMELLGVLYGEDRNGSNSSSDNSKEQSDSEETSVDQDNEKVEENMDDAEGEGENHVTSLYANPKHVAQQPEGLLTFVNHNRQNPLHWIILPFEYGEDERKIIGSVRILLNYTKKSSEKLVISAFFCGKNYKFVVKYRGEGDATNRQRCVIQFCTDRNDTSYDTNKLCDLLASSLPKSLNCDITYAEDLLHDGIFTLDSLISVVQLDA